MAAALEPQLFLVCAERERLLVEVRRAISAMVDLANEQLEVAIAEDFGRFEAIKHEFNQARKRKDMCMAAYERHLVCCDACGNV